MSPLNVTPLLPTWTTYPLAHQALLANEWIITMPPRGLFGEDPIVAAARRWGKEQSYSTLHTVDILVQVVPTYLLSTNVGTNVGILSMIFPHSSPRCNPTGSFACKLML